jgi:hypothetical protein
MKVKIFNGYIFLGIAALCVASSANAVPSFARQTQQECSACHVGSFGPQLTPYGRAFKLNGYTEKNGDSAVPVSAMLVGVFDKTSSDLPEDAAPHFDKNNNASLQEASVFAAGGITNNIGGFLQITYSGIEKKTAIDNLDLRFANALTIADKDAVIGVSLNNNPTNQDLWNTVPAWGFPYMASDLAPAPGGSPLLAGGLEQQVYGLTTYVSLADAFYAELGFYKTQPDSLLKRTHVIESTDDVSEVDGAAPYWRFAYSNNMERQNFSIGLLGMQADLRPGRAAGATDDFKDVGVDASYQYMGTRKHIFTANASLIRESQHLGAAYAAEEAERVNNKTNALNLNGSYYFANTYGFTTAYFKNFGGKVDHGLYAENPVDGSRLGTSDSSGFILQADYTPFGKANSWGGTLANLRLGLQYTIYQKFNGASKNYDGFGRDASDNNTLMLMLWTSI